MSLSEPTRLAGQSIEQRRAILKRAASLRSPNKVAAFLGAAFIILAVWGVLGLLLVAVQFALSDGGAFLSCCAWLIPVPLVAIMFADHVARSNAMIERGLRYMSFPRCWYSLRELPFVEGETKCPECGLICNMHALGIDTREIDSAARSERLGMLRAMWTDYMTQRLPSLERLTREQRSGVLRAVAPARGHKVVAGTFGIPSALHAAVVCNVVLTVCLYNMLSATIKLRYGEVGTVAIFLTFLVLAVSVCLMGHRFIVRRFLTRNPRLTICVKCRNSLAGLEVTDNCVVCPGCTYISSLYELGLVNYERAVQPKDRSAPDQRDTEEAMP